MIFSDNDFKTSSQKLAIFKDLPPGLYAVRITGEESKLTKSGTGEYLQLTFEVIDGPYAGNKIFDRLNLRNPSDRAMEIARKTLVAICEAVSVTELNESSELLGKVLRITTVNEFYQDKAYPRVRSYSALAQDETRTKCHNNNDSLEYLPF